MGIRSDRNSASNDLPMSPHRSLASKVTTGTLRAKHRRLKGTPSWTHVGAWSGFYKLPLDDRMERIGAHAGLDRGDVDVLRTASALPDEASSTLIENASGSYPLPLGWAVGVQIDGEELVVPMAVEESSVVAAACNAARLAAPNGVTTEAMEPIATGQIELRDIADVAAATAAFTAHRGQWQDSLQAEIPRMVERGGGVRELILRDLGNGHMVVHMHVDTRDSMGANTVNTLCEFIGPLVAEALGARLGLRILSNLTTQRLVTARCAVPVANVGGPEVAAAMVEANQFALVDPYRAATHNKGILNGMDPVLIVTGNDWRAAEAGIHAYAAMEGQYRGLTQWHVDGDKLHGALTVPLAVATVGGMTRLHPVASVCLKALGEPTGTGLARIVTAMGLLQNLAALRALSAEGIQEGHMRLHAANRSLLD